MLVERLNYNMLPAENQRNAFRLYCCDNEYYLLYSCYSAFLCARGSEQESFLVNLLNNVEFTLDK